MLSKNSIKLRIHLHHGLLVVFMIHHRSPMMTSKKKKRNKALTHLRTFYARVAATAKKAQTSIKSIAKTNVPVE